MEMNTDDACRACGSASLFGNGHSQVVGKLAIDGKTVVARLEVCTSCAHRRPAESSTDCTMHHPDKPDGWAEWYPWARTMQAGHAQVRCDGCGRWLIWLPREVVAA